MTGWHQIWLVARRELCERARSRAFLASLLVMLVAVAGAIALPALLDTGSGPKDVGLAGVTPVELPAALRAQGEAVGTSIRIRRFDTAAEGEEAVRDAAIDVLVVDGHELSWRTRVDEQLKALVTGAIQVVAIRDRAEAAGIDLDELAALVAAVPVTDVELGLVEGRSPDDEFAAMIMSLLLLTAISTYGSMVLTGVVEEKSSRTVEVLLARMPARNLLAGKIVGIGTLGLAQVAATGLVALGAAAAVDSVDVPAVRGGVVAWAVMWFVLGYAVYATLYGALGSLASRTEDASSVTGPVTVVMVLAFFASFASVGSLDSAWARGIAWFPLTAPIAMPLRIAMGAATWWEPLVAVLLTVIAIAGLVLVGGRVYTRAILHTGATLRLGDAWRGGAPPTSIESGRVIRRATVVPIALAALAALGALVATRDLVVSVAAGAGTYAVVSRIVQRERTSGTAAS